jgi:hypothetical protein
LALMKDLEVAMLSGLESDKLATLLVHKLHHLSYFGMSHSLPDFLPFCREEEICRGILRQHGSRNVRIGRLCDAVSRSTFLPEN